MAKRRLDALLTDRGLFESRSRAAAAVLAGDVRLADGGRADKPGRMVGDDVELSVAERPRYVSRGGVKLANALDAFGSLEVADRVCLDAGASTGGFTDCLLQRCAARVIAVDVAYGELDWKLRQDQRVDVMERTNVRELTPGDLSAVPDLLVADLSFISLEKVLGALLGVAAREFDFLAMVKPQFEVGRGRVGKGGVVRDPATRRSALVSVAEAARGLGVSVLGFASSGLPGPAGNRETFVWLAEAGRDGALDDLDVAVREVEP